MNTSRKNYKHGYLALCYHYIRPEKAFDPFPRILGNKKDEFYKHLKMLTEHYEMISLNEALRFHYDDYLSKSEKYGMLMTFDDGLSDHYMAANVLAEHGIKGLFFLPTCIFKDRIPANPTIIHYSLAIYGIERFLNVYRNAVEESKLDIKKYGIEFKKGEDDPWKTISTIKYKLKYNESRNILLYIYNNLFLKEYPDALKIMHLTPEQVHEMLKMGHSIGVHSHSHISVAATELTEKDFIEEIVEPKNYLKMTFQVPVDAFSYPFGGKKDCLSSELLISKVKEYQLAFTVEKIVNTKGTPPLELGRYMPMSMDDDIKLKSTLDKIIGGKRELV